MKYKSQFVHLCCPSKVPSLMETKTRNHKTRKIKFCRRISRCCCLSTGSDLEQLLRLLSCSDLLRSSQLLIFTTAFLSLPGNTLIHTAVLHKYTRV